MSGSFKESSSSCLFFGFLKKTSLKTNTASTPISNSETGGGTLESSENNLYISVDAKKKRKKNEEEIEESEEEKDYNPDQNDDFYKVDFLDDKTTNNQEIVSQVIIFVDSYRKIIFKIFKKR